MRALQTPFLTTFNVIFSKCCRLVPCCSYFCRLCEHKFEGPIIVKEVGPSWAYSKFCDPKEQPLSVVEMTFQPESCLLSRLGTLFGARKIVMWKR